MKKFTFEPSYNINDFDAGHPKEIEYHFFGTNPFEWISDVDFKKVYDAFVEQGHPFSIYFVPHHAQVGYTIRNQAPQDVDAHWLGTYHP